MADSNIKQRKGGDNNKNLKEITWREVYNHNTDTDVWVVIHGLVYKVTEYLDDHPGGPVVITNRAGKDVSKPYEDAGHSDEARKLLDKYLVGKIKEGDEPLSGQIDGVGTVNPGQIIMIVLGFLLVAGVFMYTQGLI